MKIHRREPLFHKSYGATAVRTMYSPRLMYTVLPDASAQHPPALMLWDKQGHPNITSPSRTGTVTSPPLHHKCLAWRLANGGPLVQTGSTEPQPGLLTCSHAPVLGGGEHVPLGDDDGCDAQNTDNNQVDEARLRVTVEGVIKPRNKTSHNQKSNTRVIQSRIGKKKKSIYCWTSLPTTGSRQDCPAGGTEGPASAAGRAPWAHGLWATDPNRDSADTYLEKIRETPSEWQ